MRDPEADGLRRRIAELEAELATLRPAANDAPARQARHQEHFMAEVQHRVRNMLAVLRAVVRRTSATLGDRDAEELMGHLAGRIDALARLQGLLTRTGEREVNLAEIVHDEFVAQGGLDEGRLLLQGPPVLLGGKVAETLGLALHELATNAVKFGALSGRVGWVEVHWREAGGATDEAAPHLLLEWTESGGEFDGAAPERIGFGLDLIERGLPYDLGASTAVEFRAGGMCCTMSVPMAPRREHDTCAGPGGTRVEGPGRP